MLKTKQVAEYVFVDWEPTNEAIEKLYPYVYPAMKWLSTKVVPVYGNGYETPSGSIIASKFSDLVNADIGIDSAVTAIRCRVEGYSEALATSHRYLNVYSSAKKKYLSGEELIVGENIIYLGAFDLTLGTPQQITSVGNGGEAFSEGSLLHYSRYETEIRPDGITEEKLLFTFGATAGGDYVNIPVAIDFPFDNGGLTMWIEVEQVA